MSVALYATNQFWHHYRNFHRCKLLAISVIPVGFEPATHSLEGCCSIQLSYGTIDGGARPLRSVQK